MYSSLINDQDYDPLLVVYLTTTGATLQNHTRAQLITYALRRVVDRIGKVPPQFDVMGSVRSSLESKRQQDLDLQQELTEANKLTASLAAVMPPSLPPPVVSQPPVVINVNGSNPGITPVTSSLLAPAPTAKTVKAVATPLAVVPPMPIGWDPSKTWNGTVPPGFSVDPLTNTLVGPGGIPFGPYDASKAKVRQNP